ncbi:3-phosphoshikimate 1-carboxyvinyltransferase OS=Streptomyces alboniger OX=132473 GN=aroA PE=3 SV=1 [Streptomyces alboniger]
MRFLPPIATLADGPIHFDGDPRSYERPLHGVIDALRVLGARIDDDGRGALPLTVHGGGALDGGPVEIDAFLVVPVRERPPAVRPALQPGCGGPPHRFHAALHAAHPDDRRHAARGRRPGGHPGVGRRAERWRVTPGALLGRDLTIEPDLSNAQPFLAAALVTGGKVVIPDWPARTTQPGDSWRSARTTSSQERARSADCDLGV